MRRQKSTLVDVRKMSPSDSLDGLIKKILKERGRLRSMELKKTVESYNFNARTMYRHLRKLVGAGEICRDVGIKGKVWYSLPQTQARKHLNTEPILFLTQELHNPSYVLKELTVENFKLSYGAFFEFIGKEDHVKIKLDALKDISYYIVDLCKRSGLEKGFRLGLVFTVEA
jgi:Fe2+ or Zn2+ uptake regulation protein